MKIINNKSLYGGIAAICLSATYGCGNGNSNQPKPPTDYFETFNTSERYGIGITSADFDSDKDFDIVVASLGGLYFYENDGEGNFTLRKNYPKNLGAEAEN